MSDDLDIQPLDRVPTDTLLALVRDCLGTGSVPRSEGFWRWKHLANPFGPSPGLVALTADGRAVALRVFLRWEWQAAGRTWYAVRAVDTATAPEWRRHGLFRRLTLELTAQMQREGVAFVFNTPNPRSLAGYMDMGWQPVGRLPLLVRPLRPWRGLLSRMTAKDAAGSLSPAADVLDDPRLDPLLAAPAIDARRFHTAKDGVYLRWRYAGPPGIDYRACAVHQGGASALVICRPRKRRRFAELAVVDLLATGGPEGEIAARAALRRTLAASRATYAVACAGVGSPARRWLRRDGFVPLPFTGPRMVVRPLSLTTTAPDPRRWDNWQVTLGDLEIF